MPRKNSKANGIHAGLVALAMLVCATARAEVQIDADPAAISETAALAGFVRDELSRRSPALAALDLRVTIGAAAFENAIVSADGRPLIAAFLTSTEYEGALSARQNSGHVTAIFSNPDPRDQVALAHLLLGPSALAVFDSPATRHLIERLADRSVHSIPATPNQRIDSLLRAANAFDAIIVLPDSNILNRSNISHVVRTLYQRRKVLIGYSATLTRVGSLASVYVPPEVTARNIVDVLETYSRNGSLPPPLFAKEIDVVVNERLARSLNIAVPDRRQLIEGIRVRRSELP